MVIDPLLLRENPDVVRRSQERRGSSVSLVDDAVAAAKGDDKRALVEQAQQLAADVKAAQAAATEAEESFDRIVGSIGNIPLEGVPSGGEDDWELIKTVGEPAQFEFEPRDHAD